MHHLKHCSSRSLYTNGEYFAAHPSWDAEHSPWKATQILRMLRRHNLAPKCICEVGCGAGEILRVLQSRMDKDCTFWGYEVSPQAFELCKMKANERLHFMLRDILEAENPEFDLMLVIGVIGHIEDYCGFLRRIKHMSDKKIFHIPLDLSIQGLLRGVPMKVRREVGHIHYFSKETALESLRDAGYQVLDFFYTGALIDLPARSLKTAVAKLPRRVIFAIHRDWAVRLLGGYSLMVLAA